MSSVMGLGIRAALPGLALIVRRLLAENRIDLESGGNNWPGTGRCGATSPAKQRSGLRAVPPPAVMRYTCTHTGVWVY